MHMARPRKFTFDNITIFCDERCPIYYCNDPCRLLRHVEKYSRNMYEEGSYTIL